MKTAKESPLSEITLRKYERPYDLEARDLSRKICLSIGLLQPGDSRDVIVDVFQVLVEHKTIGSDALVDAVVKNRKKYKQSLVGVAPSNIRRQVKRLKDLFLIEKVGNSYRIAENAELHDVFVEKVEGFLLRSIVDRVREYFVALQEKKA